MDTWTFLLLWISPGVAVCQLTLNNCTQWPFYVDRVSPSNSTVCTCSYTALPKGKVTERTLQWLDAGSRVLDNVTTTGQAGDVDLPLFAHLLMDEANGREFRCELLEDGLREASVSTVIFIAYGPRDVYITSSHEYVPEHKGINMTLTCTAKVNPAPDFSWKVQGPNALPLPRNSDSNGLFSQSLTFDPRSLNDGQTIECVVQNHIYPSFSETAVYRIKFKREAQISPGCITSPQYVTPDDDTACTCQFQAPADDGGEGQNKSYTVRWDDWKGNRLIHHKLSPGQQVSVQLMADKLYENGRFMEVHRPYTCIVCRDGKEISSVKYYPRIAFGPVKASVTSSHTFVPKDKSNMTLTCSAKVEPRPYFQWQGAPPEAVHLPGNSCDHGLYTQSLTFDPRSYGEGDVIRCFVANTEYSSREMMAEFFIHQGNGGFPWHIVLYSSAGVVILASITLNICLFCKRERKNGPVGGEEQERLLHAQGVPNYAAVGQPNGAMEAGHEDFLDVVNRSGREGNA